MTTQHDHLETRGSARTAARPIGSLLRPVRCVSPRLIVKEDAVRVQVVSANGRQITLYRDEPDVACVFSTQCLMTGSKYPAECVAETDVTGNFLCSGDVDRLIREDTAFRKWQFGTYGTRLTDLVLLVEDLLETNVSRKIAAHLLDLSQASGKIGRTHQSSPAELGTSREVVSRHLKTLERRGALILGRGLIEIRHCELIAAMATEPVDSK